LAIYFGEILTYFSPNIFSGYFISSKGLNGEVICILPIFGVIFGQNYGTLLPGVTLYNVTTCCLAIYSEEILSYFVPNIFSGHFISSKGPNWEVIGILPIFGASFWSKFGYLTPRGDHI
jgi:hypothetical protein